MGQTQRYLLKGLDCANCAAKIEAALRSSEGLEESQVSFATSTVELDPTFFEKARSVISTVEPGVEVVPLTKREMPGAAQPGSWRSAVREFFVEQRRAVARLVASALLMVVGVAFEETFHAAGWPLLEYLLFGSAYLLVGQEVLRTALRNLVKGEVFDEHSLMTIATLGALAIHQLPEAVTVMLLYSLGEAMQEFAVNRSRRSISALVSIRPEQARVRRGERAEMVRPEEVRVGELIVVQPGDRLPLDGEVVDGESFLDTSALTGESVPRRVRRGDQVLAGMVSTSGLLTVKVGKPASESAISRILQLVEGAAGRKAQTERFITTFSRYYTPGVVGLAAAVAFVPPLVVPGATFSTWVYRALVLLVISCPCALVISVPLGYFGGIGAASRHGILVKGANFLDVLARLRAVVFDKTGTLTEGTFQVRSIRPHNGRTEAEVLQMAAQLEVASSHPIAASILAAAGHPTETSQLTEYQEVPGYGVKGRANGRLIVAGNDRFLHREGIAHDEAACDVPGTVIHVAADGVYYGYIVIADQIKPGAREAATDLRRLGVRRLALLTGDEESAAQEVGQALGLDDVWPGLLPGDKVARMEALAESPANRMVAFVGDGINDAPVLTRADVGIAMGALGSDAAIEAADVVIMDDQLAKVPMAVKIARQTRRIVLQNIVFSLGIKVVFMVLGASGISGIWTAVFADMGVSLLAVLNSTRILRYRPAELSMLRL
ncbi:MAG: heavy metal translocating P-type ATPase [Betaproteobacteria bacterium]